MATIPIGDKYRIKGDSHSWSLERKRKRKGENCWEAFQWYGRLDQAANGLGDYMVRTSNAQSGSEVLEEIVRVYTIILQAITNRFQVEIIIVGIDD